MASFAKYYRKPGLSESQLEAANLKILSVVSENVLKSLSTEVCFYIQVESQKLSEQEESILKWLLSVPFEEDRLSSASLLQGDNNSILIEIGPRLNFSTALSTNSVAICHSFGFTDIRRIEVSTRYLLTFKEGSKPTEEEENDIVASLHDRMTSCRYTSPLTTFDLNVNTEPVYEVDVIGEGRKALEKANKDLGLAFDEWDLDYYTKLFQEKVKRNPTSVECFDLAQSNSEHSRHWFFKGRLVVDGKEWPQSLFSMIMGTQSSTNSNNVIKFNDNSSAIQGFPVSSLIADNPAGPGKLSKEPENTRHIIFTAETHNFPTGVAPFPGATTGTGGRIRDVQATGRGAHVVIGTAGYCFGSLNVPGYNLPWEDPDLEYPSNFAPPVEVAVEASNGASDYGNKFGEPVLCGFARSCCLVTPSGERREYIKPIMFSGGLGMMDARHVKKDEPEKSMEIVKVGGPVYRIGLGGGAASSVQVQGDNQAELDFSAVQRGDAEMEQKMNRVIRACVEMGEANPIRSIHDQGAGGNGNVLKEIAEPAGAVIWADSFQLGDPTISVMDLWGAEYQENDACLVRAADLPKIRAIGERERCPVCHVGTITGSGKIELEDFKRSKAGDATRKPVDLNLEYVLGSMPQKEFQLKRTKPDLRPLVLPEKLTVQEALSRVLRLPSVASKRYLTNKVDRSVTGLVAQQQCVGPLHTPLADVAVAALSHFDTVGSATAIGEQPIKGLLDPGAGARLSVAESLTNLMFAYITDLKDVKCSGNWMWAAKLEGEGAALLDACTAMCEFMQGVGVGVDGGKDSLSMAARVSGEVVKAPGTLVISSYVGCQDIRLTVTPDLKCPEGEGVLLFLPMSGSGSGTKTFWRLGGSALAQCFKQLGDEVPDVQPQALVRTFRAVQSLIKDSKITSGHDVSDGGLVTCLLEMAFAGNCGLTVNIPANENEKTLNVLFAEEVGAVLEIKQSDLAYVSDLLKQHAVPYSILGKSVAHDANPSQISISINGKVVLESSMTELRDMWEETSFVLERRQASLQCVRQEQTGLKHRIAPPYNINFNPDETVDIPRSLAEAPKVAIVREEGSNGDREMAAAFTLAGFEAWDVNMVDLMEKKVSLSAFRGVAFVGGFSYADVCGSAKGWAATAKFNPVVQAEFSAFRSRPDTFSFGVCNGCQLMALMGWVAPDPSGKECSQGLLLDHNISGRYESRFSTVQVKSSPSIMLRGMEGTTFGMWVSHGEGRMSFKTPDILHQVKSSNLVAVEFVDDQGAATETYPLNPNGSPSGIAGVCSPDGRHLALMPHPERCFMTWQCPWVPESYGPRGAGRQFSPWIKLFQNAYSWCCQ
ncbi:hypothetical protein EGW08_003065 [Elysia chlorotica]|uniref:Phosphoribosylformylglycinamidine synthase n=1 Tax=Elysia chlorotica TaxID=188477 RepID=A0A3S1ADJ1_ELYCH|nr:hypothetical protein EGW08_003065 [Elysia chlorotica]